LVCYGEKKAYRGSGAKKSRDWGDWFWDSLTGGKGDTCLEGEEVSGRRLTEGAGNGQAERKGGKEKPSKFGEKISSPNAKGRGCAR